jgi:hypothetical protein
MWTACAPTPESLWNERGHRRYGGSFTLWKLWLKTSWRVQRAPPPCSTCPICLNLSARYRDRMSISRTRRRLAMLHTGHEASAAALDGVDDEAFAGACLANCYVLVAVPVAVRSGIAGPPQVAARSGR